MSFPGDLRSIGIRGTDLAFAERGVGEPVVFVHGTSQDLRTWLSQIDAVASSHRAIIYSRRYARPNQDIAPGDADPMQTHVEDLPALLQALGAAPAHLVGSSWGGFISLLAAVQRPDAVRTLTLLEPPVIPLFMGAPPRPSRLLRVLARRPADAVRLARFGLGVVEPTAKAYRAGDLERGNRIFGEALLGKEGFAAVPPERRRMIEENQSVEVAQVLGEPFPPLDPADVRKVRAPALLVAGERGHPVFRLTLLPELARLLPVSETAIIPGAAHMMHEEQPALFNEALLAFLRRHAA